MFGMKYLKLNRRCCKIVMYLKNKIFLWFFRSLLKVTLCSCVWVILLFTVILIVLYMNVDIELKNSNNPVILWWTEQFPGFSETIYCPNNIQCDVYSSRNISKKYKVHAYLFYGSNINFEDLPLPRKPDVIWGLLHEESPRNVEELMHEPVLRLFNFSSTFSRYSDVPFPLQDIESMDDITSLKYFVKTYLKNEFLKDLAPVLYLQSDCETSTERDIYVKELMKYIKIDSYGTCLNNKHLDEKFTQDYLNNLNEDEFLKFVSKYKFVIAIENGVCNDYVTEKFWRAIKVGSVPIYFGSPSIEDWLPNSNSAVILKDYPTPELLSKHIEILNNNDELYETYLEHKTMQKISNQRLIKEYNERPYQLDSLKTIEKFQCFVCKHIHEGSKNYIVDKSHYDCPKPVSALSLKVNPKNSWVQSWIYKKEKAEQIYRNII